MRRLTLVAFIAVLLGSGVASASPQRQDGRILFVFAFENRFGRHANINSVDPANGRVASVAPANVDTENPVASPDGRRLAFTRGFLEGGPSMGLYVADARGAHAKGIAPIGFSPSWSPDGRRLAYVRDGHVVVVRADGSHPRRLKPASVWQVSWSPDGRQLLISRGEDAPSLQLMRPDGTGLRTLIRTPTGDAYLTPTWAPDGRRIAYQHARNCVGATCESGPIEITDLHGIVSVTIDGFYPAWSPSGRSLAYATAEGVLVHSFADGSDRLVFRGTLETTGIAWSAR